MGKECSPWVGRRLWGGGNTSPLKTTAWEAGHNNKLQKFSVILNKSIIQ